MKKFFIKYQVILYFLLGNFISLITALIACFRIVQKKLEYETALCIGIDAIGIIVIMSLLLGTLFGDQKNRNLHFKGFIMVGIISLFSDLCYICTLGNDTNLARFLVYLFRSINIYTTIMSYALFIRFIKHVGFMKEKYSRSYFFVYCIFLDVLAILLIINPFTNLIFKYENGVYSPQVLSIPIHILTFLISNFSFFIFDFKKMNKKNIYTIVYYFLLPGLSIALQLVFPKISFVSTGLIVSSTLVFSHLYQVVLQDKIKEENEKERINNRLLLSQIHPHFIYNTLNTLKYLIETNSNESSELCSNFTDYLRTTIDSYDNNESIPILEEIKNVESYLKIEIARFGERVKYEFDIKDTNFKVPTLSIQTLVENSVRHGICKKKVGGTVWVSTFEDEDNHYVIIKDNGVGFDPKEDNFDGANHVGIRNVYNRLVKQMGGNIIIDGKKDNGVFIKISIPKENIE